MSQSQEEGEQIQEGTEIIQAQNKAKIKNEANRPIVQVDNSSDQQSSQMSLSQNSSVTSMNSQQKNQIFQSQSQSKYSCSSLDPSVKTQNSSVDLRVHGQIQHERQQSTQSYQYTSTSISSILITQSIYDNSMYRQSQTVNTIKSKQIKCSGSCQSQSQIKKFQDDKKNFVKKKQIFQSQKGQSQKIQYEEVQKKNERERTEREQLLQKLNQKIKQKEQVQHKFFDYRRITNSMKIIDDTAENGNKIRKLLWFQYVEGGIFQRKQFDLSKRAKEQSLLLSGLNQKELNQIKLSDYMKGVKKLSINNYKYLDLSETSISKLDLKQLTNLEILDLNKCEKLAELNLEGCKALKYLDSSETSISKLDLKQLTNLEILDLNGCKSLAELYLEGCAALKFLDLRQTSIIQFNRNKFPALSLFHPN